MSIPGPQSVEVPVLIVGAGPAGLALSAALSRYGVGHLVVERHRGTAHTPRAHIINQRTIEIFRHLGISDRFHAVATPQHLMSNNLWVTTLAGLEIARSETWGTSAERAADYRTASPEPMANCPQTVLEPMLLAAARDRGADIRFGWEFTGLAQDQDGVTSVISQRDGDATLTVRSQYVMGADGARSRVLGQAGLTAEGPDDLARAANGPRQDDTRLSAYSRTRLPSIWQTEAFSNWFLHVLLTSLRDGKEPSAAVPGGFSHGLRHGWIAALQNDPLFARWFAHAYAGVDHD